MASMTLFPFHAGHAVSRRLPSSTFPQALLRDVRWHAGLTSCRSRHNRKNAQADAGSSSAVWAAGAADVVSACHHAFSVFISAISTHPALRCCDRFLGGAQRLTGEGTRKRSAAAATARGAAVRRSAGVWTAAGGGKRWLLGRRRAAQRPARTAFTLGYLCCFVYRSPVTARTDAGRWLAGVGGTGGSLSLH